MNLRRGIVEAFVLHAAGIGLLFLMHAVLARAIGVEGYGGFRYGLTLASVVAIVVPLGWPTALMRLIPQYREQQHWGLLKGALRRAYQTTMLSTSLVALILFLLSFWERVPRDLHASFRYAALFVLFLSFVGLRRKALMGLRRVKASIVPEEIVLPALTISGVLLLGVSTAFGASLVYSGAALCTLLLGSFLLWRSMPEEGREVKPEFEWRAWMAIALPMMFGGFGQIVMNRADVLLLGSLADIESVGLYGVAALIATANTLVMGAASQTTAPAMAAAFSNGSPRRVGSILRRAMLWSALGALPTLAVMLLAPEFLLGFFGPQFTDGALLLRILALGQFVNAATGPANFVLLMTSQEKVFAWGMGAAAVCTVLGNLLVIPTFGAVGAAVVTSTVVATLNIVLLLFAVRIVGT